MRCCTETIAALGRVPSRERLRLERGEAPDPLPQAVLRRERRRPLADWVGFWSAVDDLNGKRPSARSRRPDNDDSLCVHPDHLRTAILISVFGPSCQISIAGPVG